MSNKFFDTIRFLSEVLISAFGALWFSLSEIWGASVFPYGKEVVATCAALSTFLGIFTAWQRKRYNSTGLGSFMETYQPKEKENDDE